MCIYCAHVDRWLITATTPALKHMVEVGSSFLHGAPCPSVGKKLAVEYLNRKVLQKC